MVQFLHQLMEDFPFGDKGLHFVCSLLIAVGFATILLGFGCNPVCCCLVAFLASFLAGIAKETGDSLSPGNYWDWYDILADFLGSLIGCSFGLLAIKFS